MASSKDYGHLIAHLLPRGKLWRPRRGSKLDALLHAMAEEFARVHNRANAVIEESDPRTSTEELERWFSDYGVPSECLKAFSEPTLEDTRRELIAKINSNMGLTKEFFRSLALSLGYDADVETFDEFTVNSNVTAALYDVGWQSTFVVAVRVRGASHHREFSTLSSANEALATWGNSVLECMVRAMAPAHTTVIFTYED